MAIGITPSHSEMMPLHRFTSTQFIALSAEIGKQLHWLVTEVSPDQLILRTNNGTYAHNAIISIGINDGTIYIDSSSVGNEMFDRGRNRKNIEQFKEKYYELYRNFSMEELTSRFDGLKPDVLEEVVPTETSTVQANFISLVKPSSNYIVTPTLIAINITIFVVMVCFGVAVLEPDADTLLLWGGNFRPNILDGQWWRLLTCCFIHGGILHLIVNMISLAFIGIHLEQKLGRFLYLSAYLLAGIAASTISFWQHSLTVSVGASGAIFGMYGVFLAMLTTNYINKTIRQALLPSIVIFIIYNLIAGMEGNVDNAAHLGGLISGIVIGYAFIPSLIRHENVWLKYGSVLGVAAGIFFVTLLFLRTVSNQNDIAIYTQKLSDFAEQEGLALEVYGQFNYRPDAEIADEIQKRSNYYWKENLLITDDISDLELPEQLHDRNEMMREYCELHLKMNALLLQSINRHTTEYVAPIQEYNRKIKVLIEKIRAMQ